MSMDNTKLSLVVGLQMCCLAVSLTAPSLVKWRDLAALVSRVTDEPVSVGTNGVYLSATAARRLGVR